MTIRRVCGYFFIIFSGLFSFSVFADTPSSAIPLDRVVAVVNSSVITQNQLNTTMSDLKNAALASGMSVPSAAQLHKQALDQLIAIKLQLDIGKRNKIVVTDTQVSEAIGRIAAQNHLTTAQLKETLAKQGINYARFHQQIHDQMVIHQLQQGLFGRELAVSDEEVRDFMKNPTKQMGMNANTIYHLDDLLIPVSEQATAAEVSVAQKQAQALLEKARTGFSFQQLTAGTDAKGVQQIDLGWRRIADLPTIFVTTVSGMTVGNIKGPIRAPNGFHLLKLLESKGQAPALTENQVRDFIFQQKLKNKVGPWIEQVRKSSYVKIM